MTLGLVGWFGDPVVMFPRVKRRSGGSGLPDFTPFLLMLPPPPHEKLGIVLVEGDNGPIVVVFRADHRRLDPSTDGRSTADDPCFSG